MKLSTFDLLACPICHGHLEFSGGEKNLLLTGTFICSPCKRHFPIVDGIPHFIQREQRTGLNRHFARAYDWSYWAYRAFSKIAFAYIGMDEETGRREITDRLDPHGGRVLEVSIGPGVNLPYIINRPDVGEVFGLDISLGQLKNCQLDGVVCNLDARIGEWVSPGIPIVQLGNLNNLRVETTDLSEIDAARVHPQDTVSVTFDALPDVVVNGTVQSVANKSAEGSGVNYTTVVVLDSIPAGLRWGMTAFIDIEVSP